MFTLLRGSRFLPFALVLHESHILGDQWTQELRNVSKKHSVRNSSMTRAGEFQVQNIFCFCKLAALGFDLFFKHLGTPHPVVV